MLEEFKEKQPLFYEEIKNEINNDKISHAFLIETKNYSEKNEIIIALIKEILKKSINNNEIFENVSNLIDNNAYSDFMIIEPDGAFIKKEQVLDIKEKFKTTSYEGYPRIYLIKEADKLNKYAANSLLKFLEEPEGNIIAILEVDNRYKVLETIRSRCQVYSLINNKNESNIENIEIVSNIIETLERKDTRAIAFLSMELDNDLRDKDFWIETFNSMIEIYENAIRKKENINYTDYGTIIDIINERNSLDQLINKIDVLFTTISNLNYNLNITMMLDKFIIDFAGGD